MTADQNLTNSQIANDVVVQMIVRDLGLHKEYSHVQAELLTEIASAVSDVVTVEILKRIPANDRGTFFDLAGEQKTNELQEFIQKYIPNLDSFVSQESARTYQALKARASEIEREGSDE